MKRLHLIEFHDQEWFPAEWRDFLTDFLSFFASAFRPYGVIANRLQNAVGKAGAESITDLCSGAATPILTVREELAKNRKAVSITISDKFPNKEAFKSVEEKYPGWVRPVYEPVDATDVPQELNGFRTIFTAFHHFRSGVCRDILVDAVRKKQGIAIFEYTERRLPWVFFVLNIPLVMLIASPFLKPFSWKRLFFTYAAPVLPFFACFDGMVSCLRTYSPGELEELVQAVEQEGHANGYTWEIGWEPCRMPLMRITYLIGYPADSKRDGIA